MAKVYMCVINDLSGDQRLHRIASTLHESGYEVVLIGRQLTDSLPITGRPYGTHRMKLWFTKGKLFYLEYNLRLFLFLLRKPRAILNANDLDTLLGCFLASKVKKVPVVYDSHEYFTEVPELIGRNLSRKVWLRLEKWLFPKVFAVYTVNSSLANMYGETYNRKVDVIRNLPISVDLDNHERGERVLIYQGALNVGRGIELMIDAMEHLPTFTLWIIGKGDITTALKEKAAQSPAASRIVFKGFVPFAEIKKITAKATLGFSLEEDLGANYHFASPNKVYDYIQAEVPVLVSDLPEMKAVVETYQVGEVLPSEKRNPKELAAKVRTMTEDKLRYEQYVGRCKTAAKVLNWESEKTKLISIYKSAELKTT